ncbi:co-chaperone GroES [Candidatus Shikimatogenerans bostrichidophilus]|uniref:co-chaperone GroES n=1 Tax=Candidatus Shikimatogenerans bostrichidophilus TaxID=2943807 RepID=UPI0029665A51
MIKPLNDLVIIDPFPVENKTSSGIIIPDIAKEKQQEGIVYAVGPGKKNYNMTVKKGDKVLYVKYSGTELKINDKKYIIMHENDILAIIK